MLITHLVPGFASVVCSGIFALSADGIEITPGVSLKCVHPALFLFGKLLIRYKFFHISNLLA